MNSKVTVILVGVLSCVLADYVTKKKCVNECTSNLSCGAGYVCKTVGCGRRCRPINKVFPIGQVDPILPIDLAGPVDPRLSVGPINPGWLDGPVNSVRSIGGSRLSRRRINSVLPAGLGSVIPGLTSGSVKTGLTGGSVIPGLTGGSVKTGLTGGSVIPGLVGGSVIPGLTGVGCRDECRWSSDCRGRAVCARGPSGCRRCQSSLMDSIFPTGCISQCISDFDCQHNERCVSQGRCGSTCVDNTPVGQKY